MQFTYRDRTAGDEGFSILGVGDHSSPTEIRQPFLNISFSRSGFVNVIQCVTESTVTEKTNKQTNKKHPGDSEARDSLSSLTICPSTHSPLVCLSVCLSVHPFIPSLSILS